MCTNDQTGSHEVHARWVFYWLTQLHRSNIAKLSKASRCIIRVTSKEWQVKWKKQTSKEHNAHSVLVLAAYCISERCVAKKIKNLSQTLPQHKVASAVRRGSCQSTKSWHIVVLLPPIQFLQLLWPKEKSLTTLRLEQSTEKCFLCLISL